MTIVWLLIDVVLGVLLAGLVAPLALAALPEPARGPSVLAIVAVACVVVVSVFRHVAVGTPGTGRKR